MTEDNGGTDDDVAVAVVVDDDDDYDDHGDVDGSNMTTTCKFTSLFANLYNLYAAQYIA